uniref:Uncharacterized protein n=1 Tax=Nelumbo nucifera TaxID=4432 RepID=A0A822Y907_NELNU|nr:TPA_asm: hypothetical protein HUJ06_030365 [Nelumbo nucifera]
MKPFVAGGISLPSIERIKLFMGEDCLREAKKKEDLPVLCRRSTEEDSTACNAFCLHLERIAEHEDGWVDLGGDRRDAGKKRTPIYHPRTNIECTRACERVSFSHVRAAFSFD